MRCRACGKNHANNTMGSIEIKYEVRFKDEHRGKILGHPYCIWCIRKTEEKLVELLGDISPSEC